MAATESVFESAEAEAALTELAAAVTSGAIGMIVRARPQSQAILRAYVTSASIAAARLCVLRTAMTSPAGDERRRCRRLRQIIGDVIRQRADDRLQRQVVIQAGRRRDLAANGDAVAGWRVAR